MPSQVGSNEETRGDTSIKRNKPKTSRLRQQKLPAWQPILTATTVIPTIFLIGVIFIPIGLLLLMASNSVFLFVICIVLKITAFRLVKEWSTYYDCKSDHCSINFNLSENYEGEVFFYYGLDNFFQNHRRYMKSRSDLQLLGDLTDITDCEPYQWGNTSSGVKKIAPCGAIANSMFNDIFVLNYNSKNLVVPWTHEGLIWDLDRKVKYRNPLVPTGKNLCDVFNSKTVQPPNWKKSPCQLDLNDENNNGFQNVDFIIWMRTAALPNFRKPYRTLVRTKNNTFKNGLPAGNYTLEIENNFLALFERKSFIISTTSWAGGKNQFLGIAYIVVGVICIILSIVFLGVHKKFGYLLKVVIKQRF